MFRFKKEQKVLCLAGIYVGGQPGEYPTVLIGSIFYDGHKIVSDPADGEFDRSQAETLIKKQEEISEKTGNPCMLDVVGSTAGALIKYIDFVSEVTDAPFLVDSSAPRIRIPAMKHAVEVGLGDRAIYNSIDHHVRNDEITMLRELEVKSAVLMGYNPRNIWPEGRIEIFRGTFERKGLLEVAKESGIQNILLDTAVLDVPNIGLAAKAIYLVKEEFGLPAGCGPANAVTTWKKVKKLGPYAYLVCATGADLVTIVMGADFVLYGPVEKAEAAFPSCAMVDAMIAYNARKYGIRPKTRSHPLYKIF